MQRVINRACAVSSRAALAWACPHPRPRSCRWREKLARLDVSGCTSSRHVEAGQCVPAPGGGLVCLDVRGRCASRRSALRRVDTRCVPVFAAYQSRRGPLGRGAGVGGPGRQREPISRRGHTHLGRGAGVGTSVDGLLWGAYPGRRTWKEGLVCLDVSRWRCKGARPGQRCTWKTSQRLDRG